MRHYWMRQSSHGETEGYFNGGILIIKSKLKILVHMNRSVKYRGRTLIKCLFFGGGGWAEEEQFIASLGFKQPKCTHSPQEGA